MATLESHSHDMIPGPGFPTRIVPAPLLRQVAVGVAPGLKRWTATEYHKMVENGLILEGAPIELIDGALVYKDRRDDRGSTMPCGPRHTAAVSRLSCFGAQLIPHHCYLQTQATVLISEDHEPEPDGALIRGDIHDYRDRLPSSADVLLAIEIADSSLDYDRDTKLKIYASAGVPIYWIINLRNNTVEVYDRPDRNNHDYHNRRDYCPGEVVEMPLPDGQFLSIPVNDIVP